MTLPLRPLLTVGLLIFGFLCLAIGMVSFKQMQQESPEKLPKNMVAVTPTPEPLSPTPTTAWPKLQISIKNASNSAQIRLDSDLPIQTSGLSLRLVANQQVVASAAPYKINSALTQAGWTTQVNMTTLDQAQTTFDLALIATVPGGLSLKPGQIIATLPFSAQNLTLDPQFSQLIDTTNQNYQLISDQ